VQTGGNLPMFAKDDLAADRPLRVKICGITNPADAVAAVEAGADALGLNCYPGSKRYLDIRSAGDWLAELPPEISKVAVMVNPSWEEAIAVAALPFVTALQLHGAESPQFCARLAAKGIVFAKALPVTSGSSLADAGSYSTPVVVLDSASGSTFGGSGLTFPWAIAEKFIRENPECRVVLAGGLTEGNVALALHQVRPFGVDVTTGVESSPGRKDHALLRSFIAAARAA
jgi:phosphoribosylanthranilate isomerase